MSVGSKKLLSLLREYFPGAQIIEEYTFSNKLRLDFYLPEYNVAIEWDGPQHRRFLEHFHKTKSEFYIAQNRDEQKEYICEGLGINLIRISDDQELSLDLIDDLFPGAGTGKIQPGYSRFLNQQAVAKQSQTAARKSAYESFKKSESYQKRKENARVWRKKKRLEFKKKSGTE